MGFSGLPWIAGRDNSPEIGQRLRRREATWSAHFLAHQFEPLGLSLALRSRNLGDEAVIFRLGQQPSPPTYGCAITRSRTTYWTPKASSVTAVTVP